MRIYIPGTPISKKRPKFTKKGNFVQVYDSQTKEKKATISALEESFASQKPFSGMLKVNLRFCMPIPSSLSNKKQVALINQPHIKKPDIDNMIKFILDCMNGVIFEDDRQIYSLSSTKIYAETPQTIIDIEKVEA